MLRDGIAIASFSFLSTFAATGVLSFDSPLAFCIPTGAAALATNTAEATTAEAIARNKDFFIELYYWFLGILTRSGRETVYRRLGTGIIDLFKISESPALFASLENLEY